MPKRTTDLTETVQVTPPWKFFIPYGSLASSPPVLLAGDRIIGVGGSKLFAVDLYTGTEISKQSDPGQGFPYTLKGGGFFGGGTTPYIAVAGGCVYAVDGTELIALRLADGQPKDGWQSPTGLGQVTDLSVSGDHLIAIQLSASGGETEISGFNLDSGKQVWGPITRAEQSASPVASGDGAIFFVADNSLFSINIQSGDTRFKLAAKDLNPEETNLEVVSWPMVGNNRVIVIGEQAIYACDWRTHELLWRIDSVEGERWNTPVVSWEGNCLFATTERQAFGFELSSGKQFWPPLPDSTPSDSNNLPPVNTVAGLAEKANIQGQSGVFLEPIINTDVMVINTQTGHDKTINRVFLPTDSGAVFILDLTINPGDSFQSLSDKYQISQELKPIDNPNGLLTTPLIGNDTVVMADSKDYLSAQSFSESFVAYFDGKSELTIPYDNAYNFGSDVFSIEAWVRTTSGGNVLSQSPDANGNGFQLAIVNGKDGINKKQLGKGRIQFSIGDSQGNTLLFAQTLPITVSDGFWHHLALTRSGNEITIFVDGVSKPSETYVYEILISTYERSLLLNSVHFFPTDSLSADVIVPPVANSSEPLSVGQYVPVGNPVKNLNSDPFEGLIADLRLWNAQLTVKQIQSRMGKLLTGEESCLVGYWPLNASSSDQFKDTTNNKRLGVKGVRPMLSNLALDDSLFPYHLNQVEVPWPYSEQWTVCGQDAPKGIIAGNGKIVCFATDKEFYAVDNSHGSRKWSQGVTSPGNPISDSRACYLLDGSTVRSFRAKDGSEQWSVPLSDQGQTPSQGASAALDPVATINCVVASSDSTHLYWINKKSGAALGYFAVPSPTQSQLLSIGGEVFVIAGGVLYQFNEPSLKRPRSGPTQLKAAASAPLSIQGNPQMCIDSKRLFVYNGSSIEILDPSTLAAPKNVAWTSPEIPAKEVVTGIAILAAENALILTTDKGKLIFCEYGSGKNITAFAIPGLSNPYVYPPVISGKYAYCTAKSGDEKSGGIWIFDARTGDLRGYENAHSAPTGLPYILRDAAYFGVNDLGASSKLESEAIRSVVFGSTPVLKRESGDAALMIPNIDPVFTRQELEKKNAFNAGSFTLEAWINVEAKSGGEILSLSPGKTGTTTYAGFNLSVDDQGKIHAKYLNPAAPSQFSSPKTPAADGQWHHVAAVFSRGSDSGQQLCGLFLDGQQLTGVTLEPFDPQDMPAIVEERRASIGGKSSSSFCGLMDDVRVWETNLVAAEIASRRNIKLCGNEADLLAAWTFGPKGVQDLSVNGLNSPNTVTMSNLKIWLTDLNFKAPNYPSIAAQSKGVETKSSTQSEGHGKINTVGIYQTVISVRKADGSPMAYASLKVWASEPTTLVTTSTNSPQNNKPSQDVSNGNNEYGTYTTDAQGNLTLTLSCKDFVHSPVLWIHSDFMYPNELFHVSPAVESQKHVVVPPPYLTAQSSMMQDFAYTSGDRLGDPVTHTFDPHVDITCIRTTITAQTSHGEPMPNETLEIWAGDHLTIEIDGENYDINTVNSHTCQTGPDGTLTVVLHEPTTPGANLINLPTLDVRAGFMPRSSRFVINPAENAHKTLSTVNGDQLNGKAPPASGEQERPLWTSENQNNVGQADPIAGAINHMMSLTKTVVPAPAPAPATSAAADPGEGKVSASQAQVASSAFQPADQVSSLHNSAHLTYHAPITPAYMPKPHGVFSFGDSGKPSAFNSFDTTQELETYLKTLSIDPRLSSVAELGSEELIGGFIHSVGSDIGHGIASATHGIDDEYQKAKHVVVKTYDQIKNDANVVEHFVQVAIVDLDNNITTWVIKTVGDVMAHVAAFLKKLEVLIDDILKFLRALFDWKQIIEVHDVIHQYVLDNVTGLKTGLDTISKDMQHEFGTIKTDLAKALGVPADTSSKNPSLSQLKLPHGLGQSSLLGLTQKVVPFSSQCMSISKGSKSRFVMQKLKSHGSQKVTIPMSPNKMGTAALPKDLEKTILDMWGVVSQPGSILQLTFPEILGLLDDLLNLVMDIAEALGDAVIDVIKWAIEVIETPFTTEIDIPFLSELYKTITGKPLTILDLFCLVLAVPTSMSFVILGLPWDKAKMQNTLEANLAFPIQNRLVETSSENMNLLAAVGGNNMNTCEWQCIDVIYMIATFTAGETAAFGAFITAQLYLDDPVEEQEDNIEMEILSGEEGDAASEYGETPSSSESGSDSGSENGSSTESGSNDGSGDSPAAAGGWSSTADTANGIISAVNFLATFTSGFCLTAIRNEASEAASRNATMAILNFAPSVVYLISGIGLKLLSTKKVIITGPTGQIVWPKELKGFPLVAPLSLLGEVQTVVGIIFLATEKNPSFSQGERVMDIIGGMNTSMSWLLIPEICKIDIEDISVSGVTKSCIDKFVGTEATPIIHELFGHGREIWKIL